MITVNSFLKNGKIFVPIETFNDRIKDPQYIEGAIELTVHNIRLIDMSMWDYIDQLWSYIAQGLNDIYNNNDFSTYFPDQPIKLSFTLINTTQLQVELSCNKETVVIVSKEEFISEVSKAAKLFFRSLSEIVPENRSAYSEIISNLEKIK
ncbi:MAG: hypothetical protein ACRBBN_21775 [Methyloligellaceae bacterium]